MYIERTCAVCVKSNIKQTCHEVEYRVDIVAMDTYISGTRRTEVIEANGGVTLMTWTFSNIRNEVSNQVHHVLLISPFRFHLHECCSTSVKVHLKIFHSVDLVEY